MRHGQFCRRKPSTSSSTALNLDCPIINASLLKTICDSIRIAVFEGKSGCKFVDRVIEKVEQSQNSDKMALEVYGEIKDQVNDAIISMIDQAMVKEVLHIYDEIGEGKLKHYAEEFEEAIIEATSKFYSRKALNWIPTMSYDDYMLKVEECLQQEQNRVSDYLRLRSKHKVQEVVQHELLKVHASTLEEKKLLHDEVAQNDV
ncbi:hypothetical protein DH2020_004515 [Rehmannia glutinosa]|uniref:Cullin N-terminal domain-containing protein n=1 Tax=Rehmannia glutinosa TaxID=99300 RepID=A0ABR0XPN6_REHGL